jgi:TRAP transporter TAXI family solute receptor
MRSRTIFTVVAVLLGLSGLVFGAVFVSRLPRTLTLAVGPAGFATHRYAEALADAGREAKDRIQLKIVTTDGAGDSARLLETGKADLAIIRSDYQLPTNGQTLIVNTKRLVVVIAPQLRRGGIQKLGDLKGKRIAVARLTDPNVPLVRKMLAVADIGENDATLIECELADLPELFGAGRIDAAIAIIVPGQRSAADVMPKIAARLPNGLRFVPLEEAEAIANRIIGVETAELAIGTFGAGRPKEEVATVAISYRTMARASMSDVLAGQVAKSLFDLRTRVSRKVPIAFTAEAPDASTGARIPVHPGAAAFFEGESKTLYERYGEVILTALWGLSILGSGLTALIAWAMRNRQRDGALLLDEIARLTTAARDGPVGDLHGIETRMDQIVTELTRAGSSGQASSGVIESASLALDHFRSVVESARNRPA